MVEPTSVYITLCSNADLLYFPENDTKKFKNKINPTINLDSIGSYECGVQSLSCSVDANTLRKLRQKIQYASNNCQIKIKNPIPTTYSLESVTWKLLGLTPNKLYAALSAAAVQLRYISFTQTYDSESDFLVTLKLNLPSGNIFYLDPDLKKLLGFSQYVFTKNGDYVGKTFTKDDVNIYKKEKFELAIIKFEEVNAVIEAPEDDSLDALAQSINLAFENNGIDASITIAGDELTAQIAINTPFLSLKFPSFVSDGFALDHDMVFKEGVRVVDLSHLKLDNQREHILLLSDIIEERRYTSSFLPILRIIPFSLLKKAQYIEFHPIQYSSVNVKTISEISFEFINDKFKSVNLGSMPVSITLHLKKKDES